MKIYIKNINKSHYIDITIDTLKKVETSSNFKRLMITVFLVYSFFQHQSRKAGYSPSDVNDKIMSKRRKKNNLKYVMHTCGYWTLLQKIISIFN